MVTYYTPINHNLQIKEFADESEFAEEILFLANVLFGNPKSVFTFKKNFLNICSAD